jgi:WD40 repeat protein
VVCTDPDGTTREILSGAGRIRRLRASPDHERLIIATEDGKLRDFDGTLHTLFAHDARPFQMEFSPDGRWLASGAIDGAVIVWDALERRIRSRTKAHTGIVTSLGWRDGELWTASIDGNHAPPVGMLRFDLDRRVERLAVSHDDRYVAATSSGEIVVIDQLELAVASLSVATTGTSYIGFINPDTLVISKADGLFKVSLSALEFIRFEPRH